MVSMDNAIMIGASEKQTECNCMMRMQTGRSLRNNSMGQGTLQVYQNQHIS